MAGVVKYIIDIYAVMLTTLCPSNLPLMPSLRQSSAILSSARKPSITMRIFSSAEYLRLVARRMSRTLFSALGLLVFRLVIIKSS